MTYKNQPFLFLNKDQKECLFFCKAEKTITLQFGNEYEITPWKVALLVDGLEIDIKLPTVMFQYGHIVIECNPHIVVKNNLPVFYYVAGFLQKTGSPIMYYLCSLETDWHFKVFKNFKIVKPTMTGTVINNKIFYGNKYGQFFVDDTAYDSCDDIAALYRIIPMYENENYFLVTALTKSGEDASYVMSKDLSLYAVIKNKENKNIYKCSVLHNKIIYTVKNANSGAIEDRSLVEEKFENDFESRLIPTHIKKSVVLPPVVIVEKTLDKLAAQYVKAETYNAMHGAAPEDVIAERLKICGGCEFRKTQYLGATATDDYGWCSRCGCGNNPRALLQSKTRLAKASCPLTPPRWDTVAGVGGSVASVVDSVKGVAQSIKHLLTGNKDTPPPVS